MIWNPRPVRSPRPDRSFTSRLDRRRFGLIELFHQTRLAPRGIVFLNDSLFGGFIERANRHANGLFRFGEFAGGDQLIRVLDFRTRRHSRNTIARATTNVLPQRLLPCVFLRFLDYSCQFEILPDYFDLTILQVGVFDKWNLARVYFTLGANWASSK